jgi:hypothetical protein
MWESASRKFARHIDELPESKIVKQGDQYLYEFETSDGRTRYTPQIEIKVWNQRLARMVAEAEKRLATKDWDWFFWIDQYGLMQNETSSEDFDDRYGKALSRGMKAMNTQKKAALAGANARKKMGDKKSTRVLEDVQAGRTPSVSKRHKNRILKRAKGTNP